MKNQKGYIDIETIFYGIIGIAIFAMIIFGVYRMIYSRTVGNKTVMDMNYTFKKAIVYIGNEKIELNIKTWKDYDGEQIQIVTEDDKVYLVSSFNTVLISE